VWKAEGSAHAPVACFNKPRAMTPDVSSRKRNAFTLIETIVTVGLLAVLAAFVVPTVVQKAGVGDPVKVASDLTAIRTALEGFQSDIKAGYPNQIRELTEVPTTANHFVDSTTALTAGQVAAWNGPYVSATISTLVGDSLATGYTAFIKNFITRYDALNNAAAMYVTLGAGTGGTFNANNTLFATLTVVGLTAPQARTVNRFLDGGDDGDVIAGPYVGANVTGRFRYDKPDPNGLVVAYYLATPITK
jgi:prepilin-type N-terminal cleavage/methylation domain-containing protein